MAEFINNHTYCGTCSLKVTPGEIHECKFLGSYRVDNSGNYWCAWCQSYARPIAGDRKTTCSNCNHELHGGISSLAHTAMHYEKSNYQSSDRQSFRSIIHMPGYIPEPMPRKSLLGNTYQGSYYSSPYYASPTTYMQRYDNPVRANPIYDSGNAWHNLSAYVYDITHL